MSYQPENLTIYVTSWCGDSIRTLRFLDIHEIKYQAVDIDEDEDAAALVRCINNGMRSVPTLDIDGRFLTEPSNRELREVFNIA
jgi:glutaredoxin